MDNHAYESDDNNRGSIAVISRYLPQSTSQNDYLVEVNARAKIFKKQKLYKRLSIVLFILAILLLIGLIFVLCTRPKLKLCTTDECLRTASNLKYSLDLSVDPCEDFYQYSCGNWPQEHPNHGWWSSFSSFTTITERIAIGSLKALTSTSSETEPQALQKSRDFYQSCMDTDAVNKLGLTVIYKYVKRARLPVIPSLFTISEEAKKSFSFNWMRSETLLKQILMMDVFIGFDVDANIYNGSENVIYIGQLYQQCPLPSPLKRKRFFLTKRTKNENSEGELKEKSKQITSNIVKYVIKAIIVNNTSEEPEEVLLQEAADIVYDMFETIQTLNQNYTNEDATEDDIFPVTFKNLQSQTDKFLDEPHPDLWMTYFNYMFKGTNVTIDPEKDLLYTTEFEIQYLLRVLKYIQGTSDLHIELYMWWVTVYAMIINTSSDVVDYIIKQMGYNDVSTNVARSWSLDCALLVNNFMGYAVSYVLADESFPYKTKPKVERMINDIKKAFVQHVGGINWMDKQTKRVTLEKNKEMITFIGYPEWLFQEGELDEYYKDVTIKPDAYLENMVSLMISHNLKKFVSLRIMHERGWYSEPIEVNAFNSFSDNAINIPMAILNFPMYNLGLEMLNYGSIGSILGHELIHGFDNMGRKHDKYGNHIQWWSNATIEIFEELTQCFVKQYDNFTFEGVEGHVLGKNTLGENLADNGGLNQAFTAYKNYVNRFGEEQRLPGFENFTSYQMFFVAYGSIWCESTTVEDLQEQIEFDPHSPNSVRVIGSLQNSEEFAKAFNCPKGSFMNPINKCKIW